MLYILWDLKLKVGQSVRSIADCLRYAGDDITIRTALLEKRFLCGDRDPFDKLDAKLWSDLFSRTGPEFVEAKLAERDQRHERHGGSRYIQEPNIKEGKGGLRDLQTLHWVSKYIYVCDTAWDLVERGIYRRDEVQRFADAAKFIWAVRCHLHHLNGRAQEVLSFDRQIEIAERMGFADADGRRGVERFMQTYFRHAKNVGDLTRIFHWPRSRRNTPRTQPSPFGSALSALSAFARPATFELGHFFVSSDGRLTMSATSIGLCRRPGQSDPDLFHEAARTQAMIHPAALAGWSRRTST